MPSNHLILCHLLLLLTSVLPSIRVFSNESALRMSGQSIGVSASTSVLPVNTQDWSPLGWTGWISLHPRDSQESSPTPEFKSINSLVLSFPTVQLSHPYMTTGKTTALTRRTFVGKLMSRLSRDVNNQNNLKKRKRTKKTHTSWFQNSLQSYSNQNNKILV